MKKKIDQKDIVNEISARTGYYKKHVKAVIDALEDVVLENMQMATLDEPSEAKLFLGFVIGAKRIPEKEVREPRNQDIITIPEHLNPYTRFKITFKNKANNYEEGGRDFDDEYTE